jgi:hypothetical protein
VNRPRRTTEEKCAWLKTRQQGSRPVEPVPVIRETSPDFPAEMLEPKLRLPEIAKLYHWGYYKVYNFWKDDPRTLVDYLPKPGRATKRNYLVPKSAVIEQWNKMASHNTKKRAA